MSKPVIDLIVTHYDEPWEVGKPFFDMLMYQRSIDFSKLQVIIAQDGKKNNLNWNSLLAGYPFKTKTVISSGSGVSAARNAGLNASDAEWVMFSDFDDMFSSAYSLFLIFNVLPTHGEDCLYMDVWREELRGRKPFINILHDNFTIACGKLYRRNVLADHRITFPENITFRSAVMMNELMYMEVPAFRIKKIETDFALFLKTRREGSMSFDKNSVDKVIEEMLTENILLADEARRRNHPIDVNKFTLRAMFDAYFFLGLENNSISDELKEKSLRFIRQNIKVLEKARATTVEVEIDYSYCKMEDFVQRMYNYFGMELLPPYNSVYDAKKWIDTVINDSVNLPVTGSKPIATFPHKSMHGKSATASQDERVVVYCGTKNTYESMMISAKTLMAHTRVDKIYFLTEDDTFPSDLPDIIENINVSHQTYFGEDCPNYKTPWTYMCLMRAVFTKLFPQHSRVLSLDIDIAVNEDISDLWNYDLSDYYIAGVAEINRPTKDYINFGVVMMNLDKLRRDRMDDKIVHALNTSHWDCPEQSAFSELCSGHILNIPSDYNYIPNLHITGEPDVERITHYAGFKYWKHFSQFRKYAGVSFDDVLQHPEHFRNEQIPQPVRDLPQTPPETVRPERPEHVAVYIGTENQYHMMLMSAKSLIATTPMDRIYFLLEEDTFPEPLPDIITCINVSDQKYFSKDGPNFNSPFSYMPMLRAAYPDMFKQYNLLLSIDNDTIVEQDLSDFFTTDLKNHYFAAALEAHPGRQLNQPYFNTGVMLMNLDKMRKDNIDKITVDDLNVTPYLNDSQDALNVSCYDHILLVSSAYNACMFTAQTDNIFVRHFAGSRKPYFDKYAQPFNKPWDELMTIQKGLKEHEQ